MAEAQIRLFPAPQESAARRAQRLLTEAKCAAAAQVTLLEDSLKSVHQLAGEVGSGGEIYPAGVRELAAKLSEDAAWAAHTISTIMANTGAKRPLVALPPEDPVDV